MSLPPAVRLDRLLANLGYGSRREVHALVRERAIFLDGQAVTDAGARIALTADIPERLTVRGAPVDPPAPLVLMMHKPAGV
ncbi:MAG: 16S rRNA pseudouridine(516) synthase, partial [Phenylobacterium sp.]|nr:16S rRNA pseudouridine(516) synthase [Phenylobacterium sp.]